MTGPGIEQNKMGREAVLFALLMPWGRVGSHLLATAFSETPGVRVENEPTTSIRTHGHKAGLSLSEIGEQQMQHLEAFVDAGSAGQVGAGLKLSHRSLVDQPGYLHRLSELGFRLVLMVRRNHLKCAVSQLRALARAQRGRRETPWASPWAVMTDEPKPGPEPIDVAEAIRLTGVFEALHQKMMDRVQTIYGTGWTSVEYEALSADPHGVIRDVFTYLELPAPETIAIRHRKATSDSLSEDILNYAEFEAAVKKAGLGGFL